jgi:hypothetical protein
LLRLYNANHNETLVVDLCVEELEEVIAPALNANHNETLVLDLFVEEFGGSDRSGS